jgi:hypothetical protein
MMKIEPEFNGKGEDCACKSQTNRTPYAAYGLGKGKKPNQ